MANEKKEREIVMVGKAAEKKAESAGNAERTVEAEKPVERKSEKKAEVIAVAPKTKAERKKKARGFRIGAVLLWLAGLAFEVLTILLINGNFYLPGMPDRTIAYIIVGLVLDLACVIAGSQLWKRSNRIDPVSEKNKFKFFLWNQMGVIAAVIDFVPLIVLLLKDKDLDEKTKKIVSIIAVVAALLAVGTSIDYNPVSEEDLISASDAASQVLDDGVVYWTTFGKVYHYDPECQAIANSNLYGGCVEDAFEANKTRLCKFCEKNAENIDRALENEDDLEQLVGLEDDLGSIVTGTEDNYLSSAN